MVNFVFIYITMEVSNSNQINEEQIADQMNDIDKDNNKIILYSPTAVSDATIFVAIYNGGKMVGMKSMLVDIAPGENTFDSPITNYSGATETKIMVWNTIESLTPLIEQCTVEVE